MRILYLGNNWVGWQIVAWLREQGEDLVGLVIHPEERRAYGAEILAAAGVEPSRIFEADRLEERATLAAIRALQPEIGVSAMLGYILKRELLELFPAGCVNVHPALLPWNRGAHPNVWSIIEGTPAGVTLHYLDEGVDTGDIIDQRDVVVEAVDTAETLYRRLERVCVDLFKENWTRLRSGTAPRRAQPTRAGTCHKVKDLALVDEIDLDRQYKARDLINLLRARTFPPHRGAWFRDGDRRVYVRVTLLHEEDTREGEHRNVAVD
jgi:methionyl-tRNA formyltransferase